MVESSVTSSTRSVGRKSPASSAARRPAPPAGALPPAERDDPHDRAVFGPEGPPGHDRVSQDDGPGPAVRGERESGRSPRLGPDPELNPPPGAGFIVLKWAESNRAISCPVPLQDHHPGEGVGAVLADQAAPCRRAERGAGPGELAEWARAPSGA